MFLRRRLGSSVDELVHEFEAGWEPKMEGYSRKLVEFCCSKGLTDVCSKLEETLVDGSFSRITFDMMLAWEMPSSADEERHSECVAKEKEDRKATCKMPREQDDILLFYSDVMPLLVDNEPSVGEDAFLWLGTLVHLVADIVNGRFSFEMLTASTENRLHYPAYDMFLKEIEKCVKHLQTQATPTGMEMADDEFILHVEGTASSQRVVRHIGGTSWPGRLTLTNYALYFEASGVISYKEAIKLDLSKDSEQSVKTAATGPWGAPLYDKAIIYESSELQGVVFEFPEMTSSTRRDHWLSLVKEIMLLHRFLRKFKVDSPLESWEMHARTILGIIRLHAAREMLRISPPVPKNFLIFDLLDELPKGDYVLKELAESLNKVDTKHPCSASSILRSLNVSQLFIPSVELKEIKKEINDNTVTSPVQVDNVSSLESAIDQSREEAKEIQIAKATVEELKDEGIGSNVQVLMGLLKPLKKLVPYVQEAFTWERPLSSTILVVTTMAVIYNEWVGKAIAALLLGIVATMIWARHRRIPDKVHRIVVYTGSDQTTMESIVSAQQGLRSVYHLIQTMNVIILKIWSVLVSKAPKHADMVMVALVVAAVILSVVPFKFILMALASYGFVAASKIGKSKQNEKGNRRLHEWWDSIPVVPVDIVDEIDPNT
ncbi:putative BTB/POZ domain-containing protein KCTD9 [Capsicum annuum]|nr:putative BTB/POZ domain-containing protein KCTD9 [Capsicum annuum]